MDRGDWQGTVHDVGKSLTGLSDEYFNFSYWFKTPLFHAAEF